MWARFRKWKHAVAPVVIAVAYFLMRQSAEGSAWWYAGLISASALALAYLIEEVVWNVRGKGRACVVCGHVIHMKTFSIHHTCPKCGEHM